MKKIKLSLKLLFVVFLVITIIVLLLIGGGTLLMIHKIVSNQSYLVKAAKIESSLLSMNNSISYFLVHHSKLLTTDVGMIAPGKQVQKARQNFTEGFALLEKISQKYPEIVQSLKGLQQAYQQFLETDRHLFLLVASTQQLSQKLSKEADALEKETDAVRINVESIRGILALRSARGLRNVKSSIAESDKSSDLVDLKKLKLSIRQHLSNRNDEARFLSERLNSNFTRLSYLASRIVSEENSDVLTSLRYNDLTPLQQAVHDELNQLNQLLVSDPLLVKSLINIRKQFDAVIQRLVGTQEHIFSLRKNLNADKQGLRDTIALVDQNVHGLINQFNKLGEVGAQIRWDLIEQANHLTAVDRAIIISVIIVVNFIMLIIGVLLLRTTSKSLNTLTVAMQKTTSTEGGLAQRLELSRYEDLNDVIIAFNAMVTELQFTHDHLHELVDARTEELSAVNKSLAGMVDELKKSKEEAESANKIKSEFLANMSHELRTPLNAIIGYGEMLIEEAVDSQLSDYEKDLRKIVGSARHLLSLINDVLDLSKVEAGKVDIFLEDVKLPDMLNDLKAIISPMMEKNGNIFKFDLDPRLGVMHTDLVRLRQCLLNLLSNASKFTKNGTVTLEVKLLNQSGKDWVQFFVRDTGIGMTPEQLNKLFKAFSQADASTTRKYGGTGLGLYLTKQFSEMLGGGISVDSEYNKGTLFTILLPLKATVGTEKVTVITPTSSAQTVDKISGKSVLIIDDDPNIHKTIETILIEENYTVLHAYNGEEGLILARKHRPDVITLDVIMPLLDGWSTLTALKTDCSLATIPVILVTMLEEEGLGFALGAIDYLRKPVEPESLITKIKYLIPANSIKPILLVDDEPTARAIMSHAIHKAGLQGIEATNGREAIELLSTTEPAAIILDLMMPEMDGFAVIQALQQDERWRHIPVIIVTAKDLGSHERQILAQHTKAVLQKGGFSRQELIGNICSQIKSIR